MEAMTEPSWKPHVDLHGNHDGTFVETMTEPSWNAHVDLHGNPRGIVTAPSWKPSWSLHGIFTGTFMGSFMGPARTFMETSVGPRWGPSWNHRAVLTATFMEPLWDPLWDHHGNLQVRKHPSWNLHLGDGCCGVCEGFHRRPPQRMSPRDPMTAPMKTIAMKFSRRVPMKVP